MAKTPTSDLNVSNYTMAMVGRLKGRSEAAAEALEAAWDRSWHDGVPQACEEAFQALLRMGGNDERLLSMITRAMAVDNYAVHSSCADALMQISNGDEMLLNWGKTIPGRCDCHLHKKLAAKIAKHLDSAER